MSTTGLLVVSLSILGYGLISGRFGRRFVTPPMAFVAVGILLCNRVTGWVSVDPEGPLVHALLELTLILVLFIDASSIDLRALWRDHDVPVRMLGIGMPLTIGLGMAAALWLFPELGLWEAAVLAVILAPTDAALGQAVVSSPRVPVRIRQALNVESGLNDGLSLPALLFFVSLAGMHGGDGRDGTFWVRFALLQLTLGPLAGVVVGAVGGRAVQRARESGWMSADFHALSALGLSLLAFAAAESVGGNGFIAAFVAGLTVGNTSKASCGRLQQFGESEGQLLVLLMFLVFGAVMVIPAIDEMSWQVAVYAVLSLTVIRMVPVALSLIGLGLKPYTIAFLGWFGPRGIASILLALLIMEELHGPAVETLHTVTAITVLGSVFLHGLSATPASETYGRRMEREAAAGEMPEHVKVETASTRPAG